MLSSDFLFITTDMFEAKLVPTRYDQPMPPDGTYAAKVFVQHAVFSYAGFDVRAETPNAYMNADNAEGTVTVKAGVGMIDWRFV